VRCLYPATPHITHALWSARWVMPVQLGDLLDAPWPQVDPGALAQDEIELMLQVNGKLRGAIVVSAGRQGRDRAHRAGQRGLCGPGSPGAAPKRVIVVPGRLVNVVV
jgi:leucyl-tRNA synthetase